MMRSVVAVAVAFVAVAVEGAKYDLDFQAISDKRDAGKLEGPSLLNVTNLPIRLVNKPGDPHFRNIEWNAKLPHSRGGDYILAFEYKMHHDKPYTLPGGRVDIRDAATRRLIKSTTLVEGAWRKPFIARTFTMPQGCEEVTISFDMIGQGYLEICRVRLDVQPAPTDFPVEVRCVPASMLDGKVFVSSGQAGQVNFTWQTHNFHGKPFRRFPQKDLSFELTLPRGFTLSEAAFGDMSLAKRESLPDGGEKWQFPAEREGFDVPNYRAPFNDVRFNTVYNRMLVRSIGEAGVEGDLSLSMLFEGDQISNTEKVRLVTIPHIQVKKPKRWQSGIWLGQQDGNFRTDHGLSDYVRFVNDCGTDILIHDLHLHENAPTQKFDSRLREAWRNVGIRTIMPFWIELADGYRIGPHEGRPAEDRFVSAYDLGAAGARNDARTQRDFPMGVCPTAIYEERPFFMTNTLPTLAEYLNGEDGIWCNWEPWGYKNEGCFCTNCLKKFAAYIGKSVEEVAAAWPNCARDGGKWRKEAIAFRVAEHAKMVRTVDKYVRQFSGGEKSYGLVLGVAFNEMTHCAHDGTLPWLVEFSPRGYAADVKYINPWGPYPHYRILESYVYYKRDVMRTWCAAKDIREETDRDYPIGRRPRLMAMPMGVLTWVPKPGWFEMSIDAFFFNGWDSLVPFCYPSRADARWWRAFADATARAAKYEDFVYDGRRVDDLVMLESVPEYAQPNIGTLPYLPNCVDVPMLQRVAYDLAGVRVVAVFNFWDWGEAFFKLKATGLEDGDWTVVDEDGIRYQPSAERTVWSAAELANGISLVVPKTTTRVYELRPASLPGVVKKSIAAAKIAERYSARRAALKKLADDDAEYERVNAPLSEKDLTPSTTNEASL